MPTVEDVNTLLEGGWEEDAWVVMGNESCDMDSIVSSLLYAAWLAEKEGCRVIPVLNVVREDLALRTETVWALESAGVCTSYLLYAPEIDWGQVKSLTLVDHNALCPAQAHLAPKVNHIIDHHADSNQYKDQCSTRVVRTVGSTATLVAVSIMHGDLNTEEPVASPDPALLDAGCARLLLSTILVDTMNNDPAMKKTTPVDIIAADALSMLVWPDASEEEVAAYHEALYKKLSVEKFNTAELTIQMSLRKDYKKFELNGVVVGMSSVLESVKSLGGKGDLGAEMELYKAQHKLDVLVIMSLTQDDGVARELALTPHKKLHDAFTTGPLQADLDLVPLPPVSGVTTFKQNNVAISRKVLTPKLDAFFNS